MTANRKRQWIAKFARENVGYSNALKTQKEQLVRNTAQEIQNTIDRIFPDPQNPLRARIENLVETSLSLNMEMMGRESVPWPLWVKPGDVFVEGTMEMTDISKLEGKVALCVFPRWLEDEDFTVAKPKVYCV